MPGSGSVFTIDPSIMLRKPKMQNRTLAKEKAAALSELPGRGELDGKLAHPSPPLGLCLLQQLPDPVWGTHTPGEQQIPAKMCSLRHQ